ncbi:hypothetical protein ABX014_03110 [Snodgrassella alvi]|uniref:TIR domain-containing protein n=1 Tax=Snodgrassella alvi TaxID=1196083 RepID=UPI00351BF066
MSYRNGNYCAFYVENPSNQSNLAEHATKDFVYYNQLRMWKGKDSSFPFIDSHNKNYNVCDDSDWKNTLKPRLRERIRNSKNIILILSSITKNSIPLKEEIDYGINVQELPVIVIYPDFKTKDDLLEKFNLVRSLWNNLPIFRDSMHKVPTLHIPHNKELIIKALNNRNFTVNNKCKEDIYYFK